MMIYIRWEISLSGSLFIVQHWVLKQSGDEWNI